MNAALSYVDAKQQLMMVLQRDALLHGARKFDELGEGYEDVDARVPRNAGPQFTKVLIALEFWGSWLDSCEHDWFFYEPLKEADWPVLARRIIDDLRADREITDPVLLDKFAPRPKSSFSLRGFLRRLWGGSASRTP
jgi:hypothetical protein